MFNTTTATEFLNLHTPWYLPLAPRSSTQPRAASREPSPPASPCARRDGGSPPEAYPTCSAPRPPKETQERQNLLKRDLIFPKRRAQGVAYTYSSTERLSPQLGAAAQYLLPYAHTPNSRLPVLPCRPPPGKGHFYTSSRSLRSPGCCPNTRGPAGRA